MKDQRPVNLDIGTMKLPITAYVSILHRVSGIALFGAVAVLLWILDASLSSKESFAALQECLQASWVKAIVWLVVAALAYHTVMGIRHMIMDFGVGESLEGGRRGATIALVLAIAAIAAAGVWLL